MKKLFLSAAVVCAAMMSSCGNSGIKVNLTGEWNIVSVEGQKIDGEANPFLGFNIEEGRLYGNAGCNRIMGTLELDSLNPGTIVISKVGSTRMMCPNMDTETKVLGALNNVAGYQASANGVELTDKSGKVVLSLEKKEAAPVTIASLDGEWIISKVDGAVVEVAENTPFFAFNIAEMRVHGNAGCNIVNGSIEQAEGDASSFKFGQMISTMMAGPGMETEGKVLEAASKVASFAMNADGSVSLKDADGNEVLLLVKNDGEPLSK